MNIYGLTICLLIYSSTAFECFIRKDYPHALIWAAYAVSLIGFIWYEYKVKHG